MGLWHRLMPLFGMEQDNCKIGATYRGHRLEEGCLTPRCDESWGQEAAFAYKGPACLKLFCAQCGKISGGCLFRKRKASPHSGMLCGLGLASPLGLHKESSPSAMLCAPGPVAVPRWHKGSSQSAMLCAPVSELPLGPHKGSSRSAMLCGPNPALPRDVHKESCRSVMFCAPVPALPSGLHKESSPSAMLCGQGWQLRVGSPGAGGQGWRLDRLAPKQWATAREGRWPMR